MTTDDVYTTEPADQESGAASEQAVQSSVMPTTRRRFGRQLLLGLPLLGAALVAHEATPAQAGNMFDPWRMEGNANVDANDFLGTINNFPLIFKTNNQERLRINTNGTISTGNTITINTPNPVAKLHVTTSLIAGIRCDLSATGAGAAAVAGRLTSTTPGAGAAGLKGEVVNTTTTAAYGVHGRHAGNGTAVFAELPKTTGAGYGVQAQVACPDATAIYALHSSSSGAAPAIQADNSSTAEAAVAILGRLTDTNTGPYSVAVQGINQGYGEQSCGVFGQSAAFSGRGVYGSATAIDGFPVGVYGEASAPGGRGVIGTAKADSGDAWGVMGSSYSTSGIGVAGFGTTGTGTTTGVYGEAGSVTGRGVVGKTTVDYGLNYGVYGISVSTSGRGVFGEATATTGEAAGVYGQTSSDSGFGVYGKAIATTGTAVGVYGEAASATGFAGSFVGNVHVAGTLSKTAGSFKIDHPLDPANKYLSHSFVESPDMLNVYNGSITTDANGEATVELPSYFEALNKDFRYQLTVIGQFAQAIVSGKVKDNRFAITTDKPNVEVCWQVTGVRKDAYAEAHRIPVEEDKPEAERGSYLNPLEHGQTKDQGLMAQRVMMH